MMVNVLLYGYSTGVASSRRIARCLHEDIAFRVLADNNTPDFRTVSEFRNDHLEALADLFLQVLALCRRAGLVKPGHVALDGANVKANASSNKSMSYARMKEKKEQLAAEVAELLRRAEEVDEEEDRRFSKTRSKPFPSSDAVGQCQAANRPEGAFLRAFCWSWKTSSASLASSSGSLIRPRMSCPSW